MYLLALALRGLRGLRRLIIGNQAYTDAGLRSLVRALGELASLSFLDICDLEGCSNEGVRAARFMLEHVEVTIVDDEDF